MFTQEILHCLALFTASILFPTVPDVYSGLEATSYTRLVSTLLTSFLLFEAIIAGVTAISFTSTVMSTSNYLSRTLFTNISSRLRNTKVKL